MAGTLPAAVEGAARGAHPTRAREGREPAWGWRASTAAYGLISLGPVNRLLDPGDDPRIVLTRLTAEDCPPGGDEPAPYRCPKPSAGSWPTAMSVVSCQNVTNGIQVTSGLTSRPSGSRSQSGSAPRRAGFHHTTGVGRMLRVDVAGEGPLAVVPPVVVVRQLVGVRGEAEVLAVVDDRCDLRTPRGAAAVSSAWISVKLGVPTQTPPSAFRSMSSLSLNAACPP